MDLFTVTLALVVGADPVVGRRIDVDVGDTIDLARVIDVPVAVQTGRDLARAWRVSRRVPQFPAALPSPPPDSR